MSKIEPAPIQHAVIDEETKLATLPWILFFNYLFNGDTGTIWTPVATGLTQTGVPTITGTYYRSGQFMDFEIRIVPGTDTSSVAGTTYFALPFNVLTDGACTAVSGLLGGTNGMVDAATNRCYPPAWTTVTIPLTVVGRVHAI